MSIDLSAFVIHCEHTAAYLVNLRNYGSSFLYHLAHSVSACSYTALKQQRRQHISTPALDLSSKAFADFKDSSYDRR